MLKLARANGVVIDATELYSCFPCVPKMTRRVLGLSHDVVPTVCGGLSFFGAPLNNYMTHATCAMVRHLRAGRAYTGLLYGQGEFVTKHHAVLVSRLAPQVPLRSEYKVQREVDLRRGAIPTLLTEYRGAATLETYTVIYDREGAPLYGIVIARSTSGARIMARADGAAIAVLEDSERSPIGLNGDVAPGNQGLLRWDF
jgi:hypothetical protein